MPIPPKSIPGQNGNFFCAPRRARAWAKSVLASPAQGHSSQIWVCHRGYLSLTQNFKPMFSYVFQHADSSQIDSWSKRKLFCAPRRARAWAKTVLASRAQGHSRQIWVCHRGYLSLTQNFKPMFSYVFQHADSSQTIPGQNENLPIPPKSIPGQNENFFAAAPRARLGKISSGQPRAIPAKLIWVCHAQRRTRAWAKSVLARPAQGHSSQIWVCHRGYLTFFSMFSYVFQHADPTQIDSWSKRKLFCAPPGQNQFWPAQPRTIPAKSMSPGVPQFDPEFQTHVFLRFSACRFLFCAPRRARAWAKSVLASPAQPFQGWVCHRGYLSLIKPMFSYVFSMPIPPKRFLVKTKTFLRAAPRAHLGKISSGQPSPGPFQPNLGMSPGVPQFDPEFQTHVFLRFSACRFLPNDSWSKRKLFCAPRRARAWAKSVLASPAQGHSSQIWVCHRGYLSLTQNFEPMFSYVFQHAAIPGQNENFFARRARAWAKSVPQGQPNLGMSPGVPQFDPEFQTHVSYVFQHALPEFQNPNCFARRAARAPGQNQFWPAQQPCRFLPNFQTHSWSKRKENFFARRAARAPGQNQFWPAQPRAIPAKSGYVTGNSSV